MSTSAFSKLALIAAISLSITGCGGGFGGDSSSTSTTETTESTETTSDTTDTTSDTSSDTDTDTTNTDTDTETTDTAAKASFLEMSASAYQLMSDGSEPITISAITKDKDNIILDDVGIKITVDGNASITKTLAGAVSTATLTPGLNQPGNRTLIVTASTLDGSELQKQIKVEVIGTEILVDGPESIGINNATTFTIKLADSQGKGLSNHLVSIDTNKTSVTPIDADDFITNANGELKISLQASQSGEDTITATALGATSTKTVNISGDSFNMTSDNSEIAVSTPETITLALTKDNAPRANVVINLSTSRGSLFAIADHALASNNDNLRISSVTTDNNGRATFVITSPTSGLTEITATASDDGHTTSLEKEFIAVTPSYINIQSDKTLITPLGQATVSAIVRDKDDNPVKNQVISFNLNDTVNGTLSNNKATTNSLGRATTIYTAGDATSALGSVNITARLESNNQLADAVSMTVGGKALRLVLGTQGKPEAEGVNYVVPYGVIVTDASGNPVSDQVVEFSITPTEYYKAGYQCSAENGWIITNKIRCPIEDTNGNGKIDVLSNGATEDINGNDILEPTNTASVAASGITDQNGQVQVNVRYPRSEAWWSNVKLTATVNVSGTESSESTSFILQILPEDIADCSILPPNYYTNPYAGAETAGMSKYGSARSCLDPS